MTTVALFLRAYLYTICSCASYFVFRLLGSTITLDNVGTLGVAAIFVFAMEFVFAILALFRDRGYLALRITAPALFMLPFVFGAVCR